MCCKWSAFTFMEREERNWILLCARHHLLIICNAHNCFPEIVIYACFSNKVHWAGPRRAVVTSVHRTTGSRISTSPFKCKLPSLWDSRINWTQIIKCRSLWRWRAYWHWIVLLQFCETYKINVLSIKYFLSFTTLITISVHFSLV